MSWCNVLAWHACKGARVVVSVAVRDGDAVRVGSGNDHFHLAWLVSFLQLLHQSHPIERNARQLLAIGAFIQQRVLSSSGVSCPQLAQIVSVLLRELAAALSAGHVEEVVVRGAIQIHLLRYDENLLGILEQKLICGVEFSSPDYGTLDQICSESTGLGDHCEGDFVGGVQHERRILRTQHLVNLIGLADVLVRAIINSNKSFICVL